MTVRQPCTKSDPEPIQPLPTLDTPAEEFDEVGRNVGGVGRDTPVRQGLGAVVDGPADVEGTDDRIGVAWTVIGLGRC